MKILILDDDLGFLFWMADVLERFGHQVVPADTVSRAVKLIHRWRLNIDLLMLNPKIDGAAGFAETLRQRMPKRLKVVVLVSRKKSPSDYRAVRPDAVRTKAQTCDLAGLEALAKRGLETVRWRVTNHRVRKP